MTCYLAGPMRGYPSLNFPAFDEAQADLSARGWHVISPAEMDRVEGFDPDVHLPDAAFLKEARLRDADAIEQSDAVFVLPGWEKSVGATAEVWYARWAGVPVLSYPSEDAIPHPMEEEDILEEALRITRGDRQAQYGPPDQDFTRTAAMWSALKGIAFDSRDVAIFMICLKLSRETHQRKRDNWVDIAGYARCGSLCGLKNAIGEARADNATSPKPPTQ